MLGYCSIYGLKEGMGPSHTVNLKDKEQIRSLRSFQLFAGLIRANPTITELTLKSLAHLTETCTCRRAEYARRHLACIVQLRLEVAQALALLAPPLVARRLARVERRQGLA